MELRPLGIEDLKRMLGERDILIEQLTQTISQLEQERQALAELNKPEEPAE